MSGLDEPFARISAQATEELRDYVERRIFDVTDEDGDTMIVEVLKTGELGVNITNPGFRMTASFGLTQESIRELITVLTRELEAQ